MESVPLNQEQLTAIFSAIRDREMKQLNDDIARLKKELGEKKNLFYIIVDPREECE